MKPQLCFVEDDPTIREIVSRRLQREGYDISVFDNAEGVVRDFKDWDLYLLDVMLQGEMSGLSLCEKIRQRDPLAPVLILSALGEPQDRVEGLRTGADDYLTKPFEMEELLLRVKGMLKRRSWYATFPMQSKVFRWDGREIDFEKFEGVRNGKRFSMSQKEVMLMKLFIEKEGQVVSRDTVLDQIWGYDVFPSSRTVDNFILRLRKYFEDEPSQPIYIQSIRGTGYKFNAKGSNETRFN